MTSVQLFNARDHYEMVSSWWKAQNWPIVPIDHLPYIGFVSYAGDTPAAAAWMYQTDSKFCLMEWLVANPEVRKEARRDAINALVEQVKKAAKEGGFASVFMTATNASLIERLKALEFMPTETGMTNLICRVGV